MSILKKGLIVVAVVVVLAVVVGWLTMNYIVRKGVEVGAGAALGTKTTLNSASVHPFAGSVTIGELDIANPEGFQTKDFLTLEKCSVDVAMGSLLSSTVVVEDLLIDKPVITIERKGVGTNLNVILDNLGKNSKSEEASGKGKGYRIKHILIKGAVAKILVAGKEPVSISLPDIEMKDLGTGQSNGIKIGMVTFQILAKIAQETVANAAGKVPGEMLNTMNGAVTNAKGAVEGITKGVGNALKKLPKLPGLGGDK